MEMLKPVNQAEIDAIVAKYEAEIAQKPEIEAVLRVQCEMEVADAIGKQRQAAIQAGGELGEKIKAENEEFFRKSEALRAQISDADMQKARDAVNAGKSELAKNLAAPEIKAGTPVKRFCTNCGAKLGENARFCVECGTKVE